MEFETKRKLVFKQNLYKLALLSFLIVIVWIGFEVYWSYIKKTPSDFTSLNLEPINPNLYQDLATELQKKTPPNSEQLESYKQQVFQDQTPPSSSTLPQSTSSASPF